MVINNDLHQQPGANHLPSLTWQYEFNVLDHLSTFKYKGSMLAGHCPISKKNSEHQISTHWLRLEPAMIIQYFFEIMMKTPQPVVLPQKEGRKPPLPFAQVQIWSWQPSRKTLLIQQRLMQPFFSVPFGLFSYASCIQYFLHHISIVLLQNFFPEMKILTFPVSL